MHMYKSIKFSRGFTPYHFSRKSGKGFTLIELLVVIAIIGLLAAVVLAAVGTARNKGADAAVQSQVNQARSQAELYASDNGGNSYSGVCDAAVDVHGLGGVTGPGVLVGAASSTAATVVTGTGGTLATGAETQVTCNDAANEWMVEAPLTGSVAGSPRMWCVDSTGTSKENTTAVNGGTTVCQ